MQQDEIKIKYNVKELYMSDNRTWNTFYISPSLSHLIRRRFKRFDNKFIRPYLVRDHCGAEPKILETYSKLAMKDALDYIRRNASTIGNISGTESMSAIFRNYSNTGQFNGRYAIFLVHHRHTITVTE